MRSTSASSAPGFQGDLLGDTPETGQPEGDSADFPVTPQPHRSDRRVAVLLPLPLREAYDYRVPDGMELVPGDFVEVPLGPRRVIGVVWGPGAGTLESGRLKPVVRRFDVLPNIRRARVTDTIGEIALELEGSPENLENGIRYLQEQGVEVEPLEGDVLSP